MFADMRIFSNICAATAHQENPADAVCLHINPYFNIFKVFLLKTQHSVHTDLNKLECEANFTSELNVSDL